MTTMTQKYQSPSTPGVSHDLTNFIVEAILINRHGALPEAGWRKGRPFAKEWGELLKRVRRIKTLKVDLQQLAWAVQWYKLTHLDYEDFGLLRWKINTYFKWCNVDKFTQHYQALHTSLVGESSSYVEDAKGYKTKEACGGRKTLTDLIKELESGNNGGKE